MQYKGQSFSSQNTKGGGGLNQIICSFRFEAKDKRLSFIRCKLFINIRNMLAAEFCEKPILILHNARSAFNI